MLPNIRFAVDCAIVMAQFYFNTAERKNKILDCWRWLTVVLLIYIRGKMRHDLRNLVQAKSGPNHGQRRMTC